MDFGIFSFFLLLSIVFSTACGPGPYGFARYYEPNKMEKQFFKQAETPPYRVVAADPDQYRDALLLWFGIVQTMEPAAGGKQLIRLTHNKHKERHLCEGESSSTCRVTVHYKSTGSFSIVIKLRPEDTKSGLDKVQPGTLMAVYGRVQCDNTGDGQLRCAYDDQGGLLLDTVLYRQWPARYYVTTRAADGMRR